MRFLKSRMMLMKRMRFLEILEIQNKVSEIQNNVDEKDEVSVIADKAFNKGDKVNSTGVRLGTRYPAIVLRTNKFDTNIFDANIFCTNGFCTNISDTIFG